MARPNLVSPTSIFGITTSGTLTTGLTTLLSNGANSNQVLKINTILVSNFTGSTGADVSIGYSGNAGAGSTDWVSFTITVPGDATLISLGKDSPIYVEEGRTIVGSASANNALEYIISYEQIS